jgi:methionine sulfoxide reductase heme-binding subunit
LALIHYLLSPDIYPEQYLMSGIFFWLMVWRVLNRRGQGANAGVLVLLAVVSCLFTALLEVGWIWAYHGYEMSEILGVYFTLALGIPAALQILAVGLLIAVAVFTQQALRFGAAGFDAREKVG